jgi:hypothetical protein
MKAGALFFFLAMPLSAEIAIGTPLPDLQGEYLTGRPAVLPRDASGRVALLLLGFTYDSRLPVEAWAKKFRQEFDGEARATFYEIPMISGFAKLGKWFIDSGMRRGTPKADHEKVITAYSGVDAWKRYVNFRDPKAAYLILIDRHGKVVWRYTGDLTPEPYAALSAAVKKSLD